MAIDNPSNLMPDQEIIIEGDAGFVPKASPSDAGKVLGVLNSSGDVGWVVDQSGTFIQVQADWAETDSSQPSYIDHKPDLSVYATASSVETSLAGKQDTISDLSEIRAGAAKGDTAVQPSALESYATTSAMNTALAGKQDVINDLSDIRSGASAGATAVQPSALESYATTSAMNTALAGKQDVINDLATIRAGAALGATAAQPSDLPSSDELVPSATSGDSGKVLTVDSQGNPGWVTPSAGTVYTPGDGIDITNDVISADVDGTTIGIDSTTKKIKSLQTIPSVDQTYNASSTNAQSGTAVAQAIAAIPSSSYTAGDGIDITNNVISVDYGSTLTKDSGTVSGSFEAPVATLDTTSTSYTYSYAYGCGTPVTSDIAKLANNGGSATIAFSASGNNMFSISPNAPHVGIFFLYNKTDTEKCIVIKSSETVVTDMFGYYYYVPIMSGSSIALDFSDVVSYGGASLSDVSVGDWYIGFGAKGSNYECPTTTTNYWGGIYSTSGYVGVPANTLTGSYSGHLEVANPLPASAQADSGKVLKVNASGNAEWGTDSDTTYTAGNMIAINANNSNAIGVSTTAGITDIQQVAALPANPVATVLYLIPET